MEDGAMGKRAYPRLAQLVDVEHSSLQNEPDDIRRWFLVSTK